MNRRGFTLIEIMITLAIMSVLTILTAQSIQQAVKAKEKIQDQIDSVSNIRDVQRLIEKDVNLAFHYRDIEKELAEAVQTSRAAAAKAKKSKGTGDVPAGDDVPPPSEDATASKYPPYFKTENRVDPATHFQGLTESMHFVTQNAIRTQKDTPMADFAEVGYFLDSCIGSGPGEGKCLFRRFSPFVDKDVTRGGHRSQLLRNVSEFNLKYYSKEKKDWVSDWKSFEGGEAFALNQYPEAVELSLTVNQPAKAGVKNAKEKKISIQVVIPLRNPNNPEKKSETLANESEGESADAPADTGN